MTVYSRGDIVLVSFVFSDETGERKRPALVVSSEPYHKGRQEAIIEAISTNTDRILVGDHRVAEWRKAGLLFPSTATGIVRTIEQTMIERKLGTMPADDMRAIEENLRAILGLS